MTTLQSPAQIAATLTPLRRAMRTEPWTVSEDWRGQYDSTIQQLTDQYNALKAAGDTRAAHKYMQQVQTLNTYTLPYLQRFWNSYQTSVETGRINPEAPEQAEQTWRSMQTARIRGEGQAHYETVTAYKEGKVQVGDLFYPKDFWNSLTPQQQGLLGVQGAGAFNAAIKEAQETLKPWSRPDNTIDVIGAAGQSNPYIDRALMFYGVSSKDIGEARNFAMGNVKLPDGQYISKRDLDALPVKDRELLKAHGVQGLNDYYTALYAEMKSEMKKPGADVVAIAKKYLGITGPRPDMDAAQAAKEHEQLFAAVAAYGPEDIAIKAAAQLYVIDQKKYADLKEANDFVSKNRQLKTGEWIDSKDFEELPKNHQTILDHAGLEKYGQFLEGEREKQKQAEEQYKRDFQAFSAANIGIKAGEKETVWFNRDWWNSLSPIQQDRVRKVLQDKGSGYLDFDGVSGSQQLVRLKDTWLVPPEATYEGVDANGQPKFSIPMVGPEEPGKVEVVVPETLDDPEAITAWAFSSGQVPKGSTYVGHEYIQGMPTDYYKFRTPDGKDILVTPNWLERGRAAISTGQQSLGYLGWKADTVVDSWVKSIDEAPALPLPGRMPKQVAIGGLQVAKGLANALVLMQVGAVFAVGDIVLSGRPWQKTKGYAGEMKTYLTQIPANLTGTKRWVQIGELAGMAVLGKGAIQGAVRSGVRVLKTGRAWVDPYGLPARSIAIEWGTGRSSVEGLTPKEKGNLGIAQGEAMKQVMKGNLHGTVKVGDMAVTYRGSPIQHTVGSVLWSATPDLTPFLKETLRANEGGFYTDPWAAMRFVPTNAAGTVAPIKPGFVAVLTDAAKVKKVSAEVLRKAGQSDFYIQDAAPGFHNVSKIWHGAFETEIVAPPDTLLTRVKGRGFKVQYTGPDTTLKGHSIHNGDLVPVEIFADRGVFRRAPSPALLYATKLVTLQEMLVDVGEAVKHPKRTLTDIVKRNYGPKGVREVEVGIERVSADMVQKAHNAGLRAGKQGTAVYKRVYNDSLKRQFDAATKSMEKDITRYDDYYNSNRTMFERAYTSRLSNTLQAMSRVAGRWQARADVAAGVRNGLPARVENARPYSTRPVWSRGGIEESRRAPIALTRVRADRAAPRRTDVVVVERNMPQTSREVRRTLAQTQRAPVEARREIPPSPERVTPPPPRRGIPPPPRRGVPPPPSDSPPPPTRKRFREKSEESSLQLVGIKGVVGWKQGRFYGYWKPPYRRQDLVWTREPVEGIPRLEGYKSALRSIRRLGPKSGKLPAEIGLDMGIMDVQIVTPKGGQGQPTLRFKRDPKRRTQITGVRAGSS